MTGQNLASTGLGGSTAAGLVLANTGMSIYGVILLGVALICCAAILLSLLMDKIKNARNTQ